MSPQRHPNRSLVLAVSVMVLLTGCTLLSGDRVALPGTDFSIGRSLVATVEVMDDSVEVPFSDMVAYGLKLAVLDVHWIGHPVPWLTETPDVRAGDVLEALAPPGYRYREGKVYVVSATHGGDNLGYAWWLGMGITADGTVITNIDAASVARALVAADATDDDGDTPAELLAGLAAEWETFRNRHDAGDDWNSLPRGPMLRAIYQAAGVPH